MRDEVILVMDAKEYLKGYRKAQILADRLHERYDYLQSKYDSIRSSAIYHEAGRSSGGIYKPTEQLVERAQEAREAWVAAELEADRKHKEILDTLSRLPDVYGNILVYRYLDRMIWEDVNEKINYSRTQTFKLHVDALAKLQAILDGDETENES